MCWTIGRCQPVAGAPATASTAATTGISSGGRRFRCGDGGSARTVATVASVLTAAAVASVLTLATVAFTVTAAAVASASTAAAVTTTFCGRRFHCGDGV